MFKYNVVNSYPTMVNSKGLSTITAVIITIIVVIAIVAGVATVIMISKPKPVTTTVTVTTSSILTTTSTVTTSSTPQKTIIIISPPNSSQLVDVSPTYAPDALDPATGFYGIDGPLFLAVYQSLVEMNGSSSTSVVPVVAENWSTTN